MLTITFEPVVLDLIHPFRISRSVSTHKDNVYVSVTDGTYTGIGEAAPSPYYNESQASVLEALHNVPNVLGHDPFDLEDLDQRLKDVLPTSAAAHAAVDMALHDLAARRLGIPLYQLFGLNPHHTPTTSFTIGMDRPDIVRQKVREAEGFPILKVKLGAENDLEIIHAIRDETDAPIRVDANAGWSVPEALKMIPVLADNGVELIEQPLPPQDREGLRQIKEASPIPIIADESVLVARDVPRFADCVDGVNIKLMKCGGLREALRLIHVARAHGMQVMIGCMIETSVAITAAAHLSPLVDYVDLDGNLLISNDPYHGVKVEAGQLILPEEPGLGLIKVGH